MAVWQEDSNDDEPHEFDESRAGPEYWMHKREFAKRKLSQCLKCGVKQILEVDDEGVWAFCPNKRCGYVEVIIDWKV